MKNNCYRFMERSIRAQTNAQVRLLHEKGYQWDEYATGYPADYLKISIRNAIYQLVCRQITGRQLGPVIVKLVCIPGPVEEPVLFNFYYGMVSATGRTRLLKLEVKSHFGNRLIELSSYKELPTYCQILELITSPVWIRSVQGEYTPYYYNGMMLQTG